MPRNRLRRPRSARAALHGPHTQQRTVNALRARLARLKRNLVLPTRGAFEVWLDNDDGTHTCPNLGLTITTDELAARPGLVIDLVHTDTPPGAEGEDRAER